jgi:Cu/Ag efflux protein CusF
MKLVGSLVMILLVTVVVSSCSKSGGDKEKLYDIKGKVVAVDTEKKKVTLDHEEIPGYMQAMEMSFAVVDVKVLKGLTVGDQVRGKLKRTSGEPVITELHKQ